METLAREGKHQHLIIESTGISDPTPVAEALVRSERSTDTSEYFLADDDDDDGGGGDGNGAGDDVALSLGQGVSRPWPADGASPRALAARFAICGATGCVLRGFFGFTCARRLPLLGRTPKRSVPVRLVV